MKVAQVCGNFPPELRGGMEMVVGALATALVEGGVEVLIIAGSEEPRPHPAAVRQEWNGLQVVRLYRSPEETEPAVLERPRIRALVEELLVRERVDVLHSHHMASLSSDLLQAARVLGVGTLFTFHDLWTVCARFFRRPPTGVKCPEGSDREECVGCMDRDLGAGQARVRGMLERRDTWIRRELAAARYLTAPSRSCAESIRRHLPWTPDLAEIDVIPHGLLRPVADHREGAPQGTFRVGTFGNLVAAKGVEDLVRVAAGLRNIEVHLAGAFLESGFEEHLRRLSRELDVELVCWGPFDETQPHPASRLHLAVFASRCEETYGLVIDEALAHRVPVVVSDRGAFSERRGQGGVMVVAGGVDAFRTALRGLLECPDSYAALRAAVPRELPTMAPAVDRYLDLYRRAQGER